MVGPCTSQCLFPRPRGLLEGVFCYVLLGHLCVPVFRCLEAIVIVIVQRHGGFGSGLDQGTGAPVAGVKPRARTHSEI